MIQPGSSLEQTQRLYRGVLGKATRLTSSLEEVRTALASGQPPLVVELPWGQVVGGQRHDRHQLVPVRVSGGRLYFINALKGGAAPGAVIEGPGQGPRRRMEPDGHESMELDRFWALFGRGGKALLPD